MDATVQRHQTLRVRHELRRRLLTVATIERLTPHMLRIGFTSPELHDFVSPSHDDHIKLFFPTDDAPAMRDFTPRRFDTGQQTLLIDFALHEAGPATQWAAAAKVGDTLQIGGPRGSSVVPDDFDWYLLIGDETALPAIGRRVEELRPGVPVATFVIGGEDKTVITRASWTPHWIARQAAFGDAEMLQAALASYPFPAGEGFVWIAAEATVARHLRSYVTERGHPREWTKAAGYWKRGVADAHEKIED
ncbi:MAG: iron-chelator utilization protein [Tardiphaga sp.]|nr:iron-chelator utilization protein [Tardiphaga sp.]